VERREFLTRGFLVAAAGAGTGLIGARAAHAATTLHSDGFKRGATKRGWGKPWFSPRYEMPWGIAGQRGYFVRDGKTILVCTGNSHLQYMGKHPPAYSRGVAHEFCSSGTDRADQRSAPGPGSTDDRVDQVNAFGYVEIDAGARQLRLRSIASDSGRVILSRDWPI
jgi:hypothetical protein